jgi:hypothetical protein
MLESSIYLYICLCCEHDLKYITLFVIDINIILNNIVDPSIYHSGRAV